MKRTSSTSRGSAFVACGVALSACGTSARLEDARAETARVQLHTLEMAAELAYAKQGKYPDSLAQLDVKRREDPWGRPFEYAVSGSGAAAVVRVSSRGPDGVAGNADDIRLENAP